MSNLNGRQQPPPTPPQPDGGDKSDLVGSLLALAFFGLLFATCGGFLWFWSAVLKWTVWGLVALVGVISLGMAAIGIPLAVRSGGTKQKERGEYWRTVRQQEREHEQ